MSKKKPPSAPRRTREHVIADLAINHVERQALLCGFAVERVRSDYGIDLLLVTFDAGGEMEDGFIPIQVKATDSLTLVEGEDAVAFRIARKSLIGWLRQSLPVILVVFDAAEEKACWLHVQGHFHASPGFTVFAAPETITVRIPTSAVLCPAAIRRFAALRDEAARESNEV